MNILITGASGFIGKNLLKALKVNTKYSNDKIILLTSKEIDGYTSIIHNNYKFVKEDFYIKGIEKVDIVIHLGSFTPKSTLDANNIIDSISNINNTKYLLENLPTIPRKFIFLSTIDVYGTISGIITEENVTMPNSLYGQSKLFIEKMIVEWTKINNSITQILRIGHIYGEGEDEYKKIIPIAINKLVNDEVPIIYTDGQEKRTFLNISDCCRLILKSIDLDQYKGPINIVGNNFITVLELVNLIIEISGKNVKPIIENKNNNQNDYVFSNSKMIKYLGTETITLREGLEKEYEYFKNK